MNLRWIHTPHVGRSGFVQAYLQLGFQRYFGQMDIAEIQYHAPQFAAQFYTHRLRSAQLPEGFHYFDDLEEAKTWALAIARMNITTT